MANHVTTQIYLQQNSIKMVDLGITGHNLGLLPELFRSSMSKGELTVLYIPVFFNPICSICSGYCCRYQRWRRLSSDGCFARDEDIWWHRTIQLHIRPTLVCLQTLVKIIICILTGVFIFKCQKRLHDYRPQRQTKSLLYSTRYQLYNSIDIFKRWSLICVI